MMSYLDNEQFLQMMSRTSQESFYQLYSQIWLIPLVGGWMDGWIPIPIPTSQTRKKERKKERQGGGGGGGVFTHFVWPCHFTF